MTVLFRKRITKYQYFYIRTLRYQQNEEDEMAIFQIITYEKINASRKNDMQNTI